MNETYVTRTRSGYVILVSASLSDALAAHAEYGDTIERWTIGEPDSGVRIATYQVWDEWTDDHFELVFDPMGQSEMPDSFFGLKFPTIRK